MPTNLSLFLSIYFYPRIFYKSFSPYLPPSIPIHLSLSLYIYLSFSVSICLSFLSLMIYISLLLYTYLLLTYLPLPVLSICRSFISFYIYSLSQYFYLRLSFYLDPCTLHVDHSQTIQNIPYELIKILIINENRGNKNVATGSKRPAFRSANICPTSARHTHKLSIVGDLATMKYVTVDSWGVPKANNSHMHSGKRDQQMRKITWEKWGTHQPCVWMGVSTHWLQTTVTSNIEPIWAWV